MPCYRIFRMRDEKRQQFRWAPHTSGVTPIKPKDYEIVDVVHEAPTPYSLWALLRESEQPLDVGDVLELPNQELRIYKYVGFEDAKWILPEVKTGLEFGDPGLGNPEFGDPAVGGPVALAPVTA